MSSTVLPHLLPSNKRPMEDTVIAEKFLLQYSQGDNDLRIIMTLSQT